MYDTVETPFSIGEIAVITGLNWNDFVHALRSHGINKNVSCGLRTDRSMDNSNYFDALELSLKRIKLSNLHVICHEGIEWSQDEVVEDFIDKLAAHLEIDSDDIPGPESCLVSRAAYLMQNEPFGEATSRVDEVYEELLQTNALDVSRENYEYWFCCVAVSLFRRSLKILHRQEIDSSRFGKVHILGKSTAAALGGLGSYQKVQDRIVDDGVSEDGAEMYRELVKPSVTLN